MWSFDPDSPRVSRPPADEREPFPFSEEARSVRLSSSQEGFGIARAVTRVAKSPFSRIVAAAAPPKSSSPARAAAPNATAASGGAGGAAAAALSPPPAFSAHPADKTIYDAARDVFIGIISPPNSLSKSAANVIIDLLDPEIYNNAKADIIFIIENSDGSFEGKIASQEI
jgi:hypothetical protein